MQEILSKAFGFRNFHECLINLDEKKIVTPIKSSLNNLDENELLSLFSFLIKYHGKDSNDSSSLWQHRAISLVATIMKTLKYLCQRDGIELNIEIIREYSNLDNIIKLYKRDKDLPPNIKHALKQYFISFTNFEEQAPKQNDLVYEQHRYLQIQLNFYCDHLDKIIKSDSIFIDKDWFILKNNQYELKNSIKQRDDF